MSELIRYARTYSASIRGDSRKPSKRNVRSAKRSLSDSLTREHTQLPSAFYGRGMAAPKTGAPAIGIVHT